MRVLLVVPPRLLWPYMNEQDNFLLPQAPPSLAAEIRRRGHEVAVLDCLPAQIGWRSLARAMRRYSPDVVATGENHALYASEALRLVALAREIDPGVITVLGGAHFTNTCDLLWPDHPVDFVVRGEGEITFGELVDALDAGDRESARAVPGVAWWDGGQVVHAPPRPLLDDLDALPMPAYDLMPMDRYGRAKYLFSPGGTTIHHSRGCSSACEFCGWWTQHADRDVGCDGEHLSPHWRTKSVERTLAEMEVLYRVHGKRCLVFVDPSFNLDPAWNDAFAEALIARDWDLQWFAFMRADCILRDGRTGVMDKLVRSGLIHVSIGVERDVDDDLHAWNKPFASSSASVEAFRLLRERYPQVFRQATFILGTRDETRASLRRQLDFARALDLDYPAFHAFTPFPGTEVYRRAVEEGWLEITDFDYFDMSTPLMGSDTLTREEIEAEIIQLQADYVTLPWLARGLASRVPYRRAMFAWWLLVSGRVFADSVRHRVNPFRAEQYTSLVKPEWYDR